MRYSLLAAIALCAASLSARADTLTTFSVSATFTSGGPTDGISGYLVLNRTTGAFVGSDVTVIQDGIAYDEIGPIGVEAGSPFIFTLYIGAGGPLNLDIVYPYGNSTYPSFFADYQGGPLCSVTNNEFCIGFLDKFFGSYFVGPTTSSSVLSGSITPIPTLEPSSFALLGTGLLCVAGAVRRRFA